MTEASNQPVDTGRYRTSWRLTFAFDGKKIDLVRRERIEKVSPGTTAEKPEAGKNSGTWLELVDDSGRVLFHRLLVDPLQTRAEHHSPDGVIELHLRDPEPVEFTTTVPAIPDGAELILYSMPTKPRAKDKAAREVGRYRLDEDGNEPRSKPENPEAPLDSTN
jgi:hypothetical protein